MDMFYEFFVEKEKMEGDDGNGEPRLKFDWQKAGRAPPREECVDDDDVIVM